MINVSTDQNTSTHNHTTVSFFTPLKLRRRGGHRMVVLPDDANDNHNEPEVDQKLLKALVKAMLWEKQLRSGKVTLKDLIQREGVSERYIQHLLRLNFLAPGIKEAILEGRQPEKLSVDRLRMQMPVLWEEQRKIVGIPEVC